MLNEAELAGVRDGLRKAIVHALETGRNPTPLIDFPAKPEEPPNEWRRLPRRIAFRSALATSEAPPWPLPKANEGVMHSELRWDTHLDWCQLATDRDDGKIADARVKQCFVPSGTAGIGVTAIDYCGERIRIYDKERLLIETVRFKTKLPDDQYHEVIGNFREIREELYGAKMEGCAARIASGMVCAAMPSMGATFASEKNWRLGQNYGIFAVSLAVKIERRRHDVLSSTGIPKVRHLR